MISIKFSKMMPLYLPLVTLFAPSFGLTMDRENSVSCIDIVERDQISSIGEDILRTIAEYKRSYNRAVRYCPGNSTLFHQLVEVDLLVRSTISSFDNMTEADTVLDKPADTNKEGVPATLDTRQYRWYQDDSTDCSIVCGEPNPDDCQALDRDRYYGYLYQDQPFNLAPGAEWTDNYGTCWYTMRNVNAPARSFGPDGQLQVVENMYNNCLYWQRVGGRSTGTTAGWLAFAGHTNNLNNANGVTQCLNSVNAKKIKRSSAARGSSEERKRDAIGPKPTKTGVTAIKTSEGKISPDLLAAIQRHIDSLAANGTAALSKRQYWNQANINAGTTTWRIDCGVIYPGDVSLFVDDYIVYGGNTNTDVVVQPQSWFAHEYNSGAFVIFNQQCCNPLVVDFNHILHNSALLGFHNVMKRGGTGNYGSAAFSVTPGVYFAWIKQSYLGDNNRMGRCINVF